MVLFTASRGNNFVGGICALPSAFLVFHNDYVLFVFCKNRKAIKKNMESKVPYTELPPSYSPPASNPYPTAGGAAATPYPGPVDPRPTTYGYTQPPAGHPPPAGYGYGAGSPYQSSQQQQVVVVGAGQQQPIIVQHVPSYAGHIVFSCFVFWCCNPLFGLIAFILAG